MRRERITNKFGTSFEKRIPKHHKVNKRIAKDEVKRWESIIKADKRKEKHAEKQLRNAIG
jgi:hypothetical protein